MATFKQYRYFGDGNTDNWNYPSNINKEGLVTGTIFGNLSAAKIRIQAPPGTEFLFNYNTNTTIVDDSGVFEIDFGNQQLINKLLFSEEAIEGINQNVLGGLLIDIYSNGTDEETDASSILV